jgi:predicted HAD superfamily Cof-like phosphohydrolase
VRGDGARRVRPQALDGLQCARALECERCEGRQRDAQPPGRSFAAQPLAEFHEHPNALDETTNTQALRQTLHQEEHEELIDALKIASAPLAPGSERVALGQVARELADGVYVAYGTAWAFGIDLDAALAEIHRCAMVKMDAGLRRADGKILKPPGFVPPDMTTAIAKAELRPGASTKAAA